MMVEPHFELFFAYLSGIYREIHRLRSQFAGESGVKSVYIFWIYLLREHPQGLTAAELADASKTTSSLVSREISELVNAELICTDTRTDRRRYGWKFHLTEKGQVLADRIDEIALRVQTNVSRDIPAQDLDTFYRVMEKLYEGFKQLEETNILLSGESK